MLLCKIVGAAQRYSKASYLIFLKLKLLLIQSATKVQPPLAKLKEKTVPQKLISSLRAGFSR